MIRNADFRLPNEVSLGGGLSMHNEGGPTTAKTVFFVFEAVCSREARVLVWYYNFAFINLRALAMTDTELRLMAAAATIGESSQPKTG